MSSGTRYESDAGRKVIDSATMGRIERLGMTPRQQMLNRLYSYYRCVQYDACKVDWDGYECANPIDHEAIATAGFLPPGFYDAGATFPLKFRKPSSPYHLVKVITDRFTGLLFSERHHPVAKVLGDLDTEDYVAGIAKASRLWSKMILARTYGGAMGSVAVGFQFLDGKPHIDVFDPRWIFPEFADRWELKLSRVEVRYMYPQERRDPETGMWIPIWYWYRRIIDDQNDVVFEPEPVDEGDEPEWVVAREVQHGLGFCPVVWTQNLPVQDDLDGDPDCQGIYDTVDSIDRLIAQANRGTLANCDPTLVLTTDARLADVAKGSNNAIKLPAGSDAKYLELQGSAAKAAADLANTLRGQALEVAQCVLEHPDVAQQTATEIQRRYESMLAKADVLREQYGERCVKPLLEMMLEAARKLNTPRVVEGQAGMVRYGLTLPPRSQGGKLQPQKLGPGGPLDLRWPHYFAPSVQDAAQAVTAAVTAKQGHLIDQEHASSYVAEHFHVEDVDAMLKKIESEKSSDRADLEAMALGAMPPEQTGGGGPPEDEGA